MCCREKAKPGSAIAERRLPERTLDAVGNPSSANDAWSADFMADARCPGRRFLAFNINYDFKRELLKIKIDSNPPHYA